MSAHDKLPRLSASVVLLRRVGARGRRNNFEVLLAQRSSKMKAFSSVFVFPGGVAEEGDAAVARHFGDRTADGAPKITGLRELFEEAGVLLTCEPGHKDAVPVKMSPGEKKKWQQKVHKDAKEFENLLEVTGKAPALSALHYWVTFVTPKVEKHRFRAAFFLAVVEDAHVQVDGGETVKYTWATPEEALDMHSKGEIALLPPQYFVLRSMNEFIDVDELIQNAMTRERRLPILPHFTGMDDDGNMTLVYPGDEEHPDFPGEFGERRRIHCLQPMGRGGYNWETNLEVEPSLENWKGRSSKL